MFIRNLLVLYLVCAWTKVLLFQLCLDVAVGIEPPLVDSELVIQLGPHQFVYDLFLHTVALDVVLAGTRPFIEGGEVFVPGLGGLESGLVSAEVFLGDSLGVITAGT